MPVDSVDSSLEEVSKKSSSDSRVRSIMAPANVRIQKSLGTTMAQAKTASIPSSLSSLPPLAQLTLFFFFFFFSGICNFNNNEIGASPNKYG